MFNAIIQKFFACSTVLFKTLNLTLFRLTFPDNRFKSVLYFSKYMCVFVYVWVCVCKSKYAHYKQIQNNILSGCVCVCVYKTSPSHIQTTFKESLKGKIKWHFHLFDKMLLGKIRLSLTSFLFVYNILLLLHYYILYISITIHVYKMSIPYLYINRHIVWIDYILILHFIYLAVCLSDCIYVCLFVCNLTIYMCTMCVCIV